MYEKIGQKIMTLAKISAIVFITFCVIMGIFFLIKAEGARLQGVALCALIGYLAYVSTWALYGFGQLIDDVHAIRNQTTTPAAQDDELPDL